MALAGGGDDDDQAAAPAVSSDPAEPEADDPNVSLEEETEGGDEDRDPFDDDYNDNDDDGDDDREGGSGYVELEGRITDILSATSFTLGSYTVDIKNATKLEIDDRRVSVVEFIGALQINDVVEVEGTWSSNNVINAYEAELEDD